MEYIYIYIYDPSFAGKGKSRHKNLQSPSSRLNMGYVEMLILCGILSAIYLRGTIG